MTKIFFAILLIVVTVCTQAQNVGIGTTSPHGTAQLEISSNAKGILIPRMASSERIGIVGPALGLMVYQTNGEEGFYYFDGFIWQMVGKGGNSWVKSGTNIYNENDKVGVGTTTPNTKLHVADGTEASLTSGSGFVVIGNNAATNIVLDDNEVQARNNGAAAPLSIQPHAGNVGIGTLLTAPASKVQIAGGVEVAANQHGSLLIGETVSTNLAFDTDEIQARSNATTASPLYLQTMGGNSVFGTGNIIANGRIGIGQPSPSVKLQVEGGTDAGPTGGGFVQIGSSTSANIALDNNEIMARDNGATSPLYLQYSGGKTIIGEDIEINGNITGAIKLEQNSVTVNANGYFTLTVGNKSFIKITNTAPYPGFGGGIGAVPILTNGEAIGQILVILIGAGTGRVDFIDNPNTNNLNLHQNRLLAADGTLTLIWTGTTWNEVAVSDN
jgi:hypothetical protein